MHFLFITKGVVVNNNVFINTLKLWKTSLYILNDFIIKCLTIALNWHLCGDKRLLVLLSISDFHFWSNKNWNIG